MLAKLRVSRLLHRYTPGEGLGTAKSFVDVAYNYVTVNNKGGATCNNNTLRFFIYHKIDSNIASEALDQAVSLLPLSRRGTCFWEVCHVKRSMRKTAKCTLKELDGSEHSNTSLNAGYVRFSILPFLLC